MDEFQGQQLTPLAQVLSYEAPSFNSRLDFIKEQRMRMQRNRDLKDKFDYDIKVMDYKAGLETEQAKEVAKIRGMYDVQQQTIKSNADLNSELAKAMEAQRKEKAARIKESAQRDMDLFIGFYKDDLIPDIPRLTYDETGTEYVIKVGETPIANSSNVAEVTSSLAKRKKLLNDARSFLEDENVASTSFDDGGEVNFGKEQIQAFIPLIQDLNNSAILVTLNKGITPAYKTKVPKEVRDKEVFDMRVSGMYLKTATPSEDDVDNTGISSLNGLSVAAIQTKLGDVTDKKVLASDFVKNARRIPALFANWAILTNNTNADPKTWKFNQAWTTEDKMFVPIQTDADKKFADRSKKSADAFNQKQ